VLCLWLGQFEFLALFWLLICGLVKVLCLSLLGNSSFFSSHFAVATIELDLFSGAYVKVYYFCGVQ